LRKARTLDNRLAAPNLTLAKYYDSGRENNVALFYYRRFIALGGKNPDAEKRAAELEGQLKERGKTPGRYTERIVEDAQARLWRVIRYNDGTEERIPIEK
jgi:hypothetical protein